MDAVLQMCATNAEQRGRITSIDLLAMLLLMQPRMLLAAFATRVHCNPMVSLFATRTPRSFSAQLLSSLAVPVVY